MKDEIGEIPKEFYGPKEKEICYICGVEEVKGYVHIKGWATCTKCMEGIHNLGAKKYIESLK